MNRASRLASCVFPALMSALGLSSNSVAQTGPLTFDQGVACKDFAITVSFMGGNQVYREFLDREGKPIRWLSAGKGTALTFTNMSTGEQLTVTTGGSVTHGVYNPDGTQTQTGTGHNVWIFYPSDVPAGPSTILYLGKVVVQFNPSDGFAKLLAASGQRVDICAALSN